jgi:hypothetical protein
MTAEGWHAHTSAHPQYEQTAALNRALRDKGIEEVHDSKLDPIPFGHSSKWADSGVSTFAPLFVCHFCGLRLRGKTTYDSHIGMHNNRIARGLDKRDVKCRFNCGKAFDDAAGRFFHERDNCKNRPNKPSKQPCPKCGNLVMDVKRHQRQSKKCKAM